MDVENVGKEKTEARSEQLIYPNRTVQVAGKEACSIVFGTDRFAATEVAPRVIWATRDRERDAREIALLQTAFGLGFNFFDTALMYGASEALVGQALMDVRDKVVIATKVGRMWTNNWGLEQEIAESVRRLKTKPDILFIHDRWEGHMGEEMDRAIEVLVRSIGKQTQAIGISNFRPDELLRAIEVARGAGGEISVYQAKINLTKPRQDASGLMRVCQDNGIQFIASSALGKGAGIDASQLKPGIAETKSQYEDLTLAQFAILAELEIGTLPIFQSHNEAHMKEVIKVFEYGMKPTDIKALRKIILNESTN